MSKTIVVTCADSELGKVMIQRLSAEGHGVIAVMADTLETNPGLKRELQEIPNVEVVVMDGTDERSVRNAVNFIVARYGHIDVLINSAEMVSIGLVEATSVDLLKKILEINFIGPFAACQAVLPVMRKHGEGLIINICSDVTFFTPPFTTAFTISNAALQILSEGLKAEVKQLGIEVTLIQANSCLSECDLRTSTLTDMAGLIKSYGEKTAHSITSLRSALTRKKKQGRSAQIILAEHVLELINKKKGSRPCRLVIYPEAAEMENEVVNVKKKFKDHWIKNFPGVLIS